MHRIRSACSVTTHLYLLRHARSAPSPHLPASDYPLAPEGRAQAEALVAPLSRLGITRIHSSPWPRALETCRPFAEAADLEIRLDEELRERRIADRWLPDFEGFARECWEDRDRKEPGCESSRECQDRTVAALERIVAAEPDETHLVSMHGQNLALALAHADAAAGFQDWRALHFPDLRLLLRGADGTWSWDRAGAHGLDGA